MADAELKRIAALEKMLEVYKTTLLPSIEAMVESTRRSAYARRAAEHTAQRATRLVKVYRTIRGKVDDLRASLKYNELPADEPDLQRLVSALRRGNPVSVDAYASELACFRRRSEQPLHKYRIDGRRIEYDRVTGTYALLAEWWQ